MTQELAVIGLWHLGCSIAAAWNRLGWAVEAIDFNESLVERLRRGQPPIFEPGLGETLADGLAQGTLRVSSDPAAVRGSRFVFLAYDTPVMDDDSCDLTPIWQAVEVCGPHLDPHAIVVISSQLPVGTSRQVRSRLRDLDETLEVVYSPENLRLGESIACYLDPGHIVIGAESSSAGAAVERLFRPMRARCFHMNLPSAELVKHCINSFLATSVTLANHWADVASATGADFFDVVPVLRADPRIGPRAYIAPGVGFSGGTLGRDLRVLDQVSRERLGGEAAIFGAVWDYNQRRIELITRRVVEVVGGGGRVCILGMTYKPGTSTLRRSLPLALARNLVSSGIEVQAHDPRADWSEVELDQGLTVASTPYDAAESAGLLIVMTEWPEYSKLDLLRIGNAMCSARVLDPKGFFRPVRDALTTAGFSEVSLVRAADGADT